MRLGLHRPIIILALAHLMIDCYSSMFGAFLPFLHQERGLSLGQAGILGGALAFSSALTQPLYGYLADRLRSRVFLVAGPALAAIFISSLGLASDFSLMLLMVILGGTGIAAFHPQGAGITAQLSEGRRGLYMSVFISVGMAGYALGPVYITTIITLVGLHNSYWAALPGLAMSIFLAFRAPGPVKQKRVRQSRLFARLRRNRKPLFILYMLVVVRASIQMSFVAFLPLYLTTRGYSALEGSQILTLFLAAGGSAGFLGGLLSDRFGGKGLITLSMLGCCPMLLGFLWTEGWISILLCVAGSAFLLSTAPVNVVLAQQLVPEGVSTVSAFLMGFAWGVGGLFIPGVGFLSEEVGLQIALSGIALLGIPGILLAMALPARIGQTGLVVREPAIESQPVG